ncbi:MAG: OmpH family outer membrane protein [Pseudomonadota bacterium]
MRGGGLARWLLVGVLLTLAHPALSQQEPIPGATVLTIDPERLFAETAFGIRAIGEIEQRATELAAENRRIEAELIAEERDLTERRPTLPVDEFRTLADAFDAKVDEIRAAQDAKLREVQGLRENAQQAFFGRIGPILAEILNERQALVVLDRRNVFAASEAADITDIAISRIDAEIGDGSGVSD